MAPEEGVGVRMGSVPGASHGGSAAAGRGRRAGPRRACAGVSLAFVALLAGSAQVSAQTVTVPAAADATIEKGSPNKNLGAQATLVLKEGGSRVLVRFDAAAITAAVGGGSLATAALQVYIGSNAANWGATGRTVDVYRLDAGWTEAGATWNCGIDGAPGNGQADCAAQWNGGTAEDEATDTIVVTNASQGWVQFDVTADVAAFLAGTADEGWLIEKTDEGQAGRVDLVSREGTAGLGPRLVLVSQSATVDTVPPALSITVPGQPVLVNVPSPVIGLSYQDPGSGVDTSTLRVLVDGQDLTAGCSIGTQAASCVPPALAGGTHTITASLSDHAGNVATAVSSFRLLLGPALSMLTLPVSADTYITARSPDREHGRAAILRVAKSGPSRALIEIDPAALAAALAGNQILSAQLEVGVAANARNWGAAGRTIGAYRLTALTGAWSEAAATWDCAADTNLDNAAPDCAAPWNGGSFVATPTATALITRQTTGGVSFDVTADVAAFLAGTANDGWLIGKTDETLSGRLDLTSREAGSGAAAQLVVVVQVPAPPPPPPTAPTVAITAPVDGTYSRSLTIQVTGQAGGSAIGVTVNSQAATLGPGGAFAAQVALSPGFNSIVTVASDAAGDQATASVGVILDTTPPTVTLTSPLPGAITNQAQVTVAGTALDDNGVASLTVAGQPVALAGDQFSTSVQLAAGSNPIAVTASDLAGNTQTVTVAVTRFSVPVVAIAAPADLSYVNATTVTVSGTATGATSVSVNGVAAALTGSGFTAAGVPLIEGGNTLTATATDGQGHVGIASINVVRDLTPPHVAIYTPAAGAMVTGSSVTVSGLVNDIVAGTVNSSNATVTVNGIPATVANRSFIVSNVALQPGNNVLTAVAVDAAGNQAQATVTVRQMTPAGPRIAVAAGNGQSAPINTPLPQPLVAVLLDGSGQPVVGQQVLFQAAGTDGTFDNGRRTYAVTSDVAGQAAVHFTVGSHAGAGNQLVKASAPGFSGPAQFVSSAQPGGPALLVVDAGDQQQGVAGQALPLPLVAVVVDAGANRLAGVAATLKVVKGAGSFTNGQQTLALTSDSDGRLIASFITDPAEGVANNVVEASIDALPTAPPAPVVSFTASALAAYDPAMTAISGVVLDNSNQPVPGATLRILGTALTAVSDAQGLFELTAVPAGTLQLIVDGSTVQRPGSWPQLEFNLTPVPGRNNTLRMPVYLLPLDLENGILVDEMHGGTLTLPQLPGFALTIQPGSVTFPGGGRSGTVSVTVVHSDKVPMVPNFGQQPRLIVTIQPAGAQFNPPATLSLPNVEGFAAGKVAELYSFDHDLGHFVSIGPGTVSDDGTVITSNAGVGIVKAGWHCCGFPDGTGAPNGCPDCTDCTGSDCLDRKLCKACNSSSGACDGQGLCHPGRDLIPFFCNQPGYTMGVVAANPITSQCSTSTNGAKCGGMLHVDYTKVTNTCNNVDLFGSRMTETVTSDHKCTPKNTSINVGAGCAVVGANLLIKCFDDYYLCADLDGVPIPYACTETYTQRLFIGGCLAETHFIKLTITRSANGSCGGDVSRQ